ncbi:amino acid adenylation domain-containing protein [Sphaerisporangium corydalis]|uniref:Amino acid adenylation domain-containing protein n=1 Tax=Sphaerisporangium corydalis TaxID=1441875 RepID=A0ABV9E876_9ACTN|nr:amino acid adenylation domain-containing protein [Sphaerisporangium corydalis]
MSWGDRGGRGRLELLVSAQAERDPGARAVVDGAAECGYGELENRANRLARALVDQGVGPGDRVCLMVPKSVSAIVAVLGVLKSGACYVPMDTASPARRLGRVLRRCGPCWVVADPGVSGLVAGCLDEAGPSSVRGVLWLGPVPEDFTAPAAVRPPVVPVGLDDGPAEPPPVRGDAGDLAYIMFTSGSTGEPKGVPVTHASVRHFTSWANTRFGLGPGDRVSGHAPLHFDISVWDVFGALTSGARLYLVPPHANLLPSLTADFLRRTGLTQWFSVPSVLVQMARRDVVAYGDFPDLRRLIWVGEVFPAAAVRYWMERLPHVELTNVYGPTETTIASSHHTLTSVPGPGAPPVPIGRAIPGERLAVLGADLAPLAPGVVGDLHIAGAGLSPGYWRDPAATAAAFREAPGGERWYRTGDLAAMDAEGVFHFHGRADRQVKARGHRVELDEIAVALGRVRGLSAGAVVAVSGDGFEGTEICAAYVPVPGGGRGPAELRAELAGTLPPYMVPTRWLVLDSMPMTPNGKTDHRAIEHRFLDATRRPSGHGSPDADRRPAGPGSADRCADTRGSLEREVGA